VVGKIRSVREGLARFFVVGGKWLQRWYQQRSAAPKPRGGSVSPLEEFAVEILDLIAQRPDLTLVETVAELRKRRIKTNAGRPIASPRGQTRVSRGSRYRHSVMGQS
jgi:transposase